MKLQGTNQKTVNVKLQNRICRNSVERMQRKVHPFGVLVAYLCLVAF